MPLATWSPETATIKIDKRGSYFQVRGLSLSDVTMVLRDHSADVERMVSFYNSIADATGKRDIGSDVITMMLTDMPALAAKVIAVSSDEDGVDPNKVIKLPLPAQMEALSKIMKLTFEEVGGIKKFGRAMLAQLNEMGFSLVPSNISMALVQKMNGLKKGSSPSTKESEPT